MLTLLIIILILGASVFFAAIGIYNALISLIEAVKNNKRQIDIQLDRRFKVFESLIATVKTYMDYEKTTLKDVVALRKDAQAASLAGDDAAQIAAENKISQIASSINVVFEQYPDLKANQNAMQLQEEIVSTENKLSFAKQAYNDSIERYYAKKKSFIESVVVSFYASELDQSFEYWSLPDEKIAAHEAYTVNFQDKE